MEITVLDDDDMEAAFHLWAGAFYHGGRASIPGWREDVSRNTGRTTLGLKAPELMACLVIIDFEIYFGEGATAPMGGIAAVASRAEARGRGYAGALLRSALERMRDHGQAFSMLFPFSWDYYRRFGWEWVGEQRRYSVPTRVLAASPETEHVRSAGPADRSTIQALYAEYGRRYRGPIVRDEALWNGILEDTEAHFTFTYLYEKEGSAEGYLCFRGGGEEETRIREFAALTSRARAGLLGLLRRHEMKVKRFSWSAPADDLFWAHGYHWDIETKLAPIVQARIVDVAQALGRWKPSVQNQDRASIVFAITDEAAPWNARTWKVEVQGDIVHVEETKASAPFTLDIQTLTQAMFGSVSLSALHRAGAIQTEDPSGLSALDRLFQGPPVWLNNHF